MIPDDLRRRLEVRSRAMFDITISASAFRLYCLLDDYAAKQGATAGEAWPRKQRLAVQLALSERQVFRALAELTGKYLEVRMEGRKAIYRLCWAPGECEKTLTKMSVVEPDHCQKESGPLTKMSVVGDLPLYEPVLKNQGCTRCEGRGWGVFTDALLHGKSKSHVFLCGCISMTLAEAERLAREDARRRA